MKIGYRIKNLRKRERMTLKALAKKTRLTTSFLSQLERDLTSPSIGSLEKIANALNVKVVDFFQDRETEELIFVRKETSRRVIDKKRKILIQTLASGFFDINMQSRLFILDIGSRLTKEHIPSQGEKFIFILKGAIKLIYDKKEILCKDGDSIYCAYSYKPQALINVGKTKVKLLYISFIRF
jgi:transcriptional regulator with XRE-family HTH domain